MKVFMTLPLLKFVYASPAPLASDTVPNGHLLPRVNQQQLINPDNEPAYTDLLMGSQQEKSRILSGVGPQEAIDRWWDWDETCSDDADRAMITATFQNAMSLAQNTITRLDTLRSSLPQVPKPSGKTDVNRNYILKNDQAFAQMFGGRDDMITYVRDSFDLVTTRAQSFQGRNSQGPSSLRFICDKQGTLKNEDGTSYCGNAQAVTVIIHPVGGLTIEPRYQLTTSSGIVFCPPFFNDAEFPSFEVRQKQSEHTLDKIDCKERILLHEYLHLQWTRDMAPTSIPRFEDYTGFFEAARVGKMGIMYTKQTPDCYAWYALYSYFNNENGGCRDVWPKGVKKQTTKSTKS